MDKLIRGNSKNARFFVADTTNIIKKAANIHNCSPLTIDAFGRLLTAGIIMGSTLKGRDLLTLTTNTNGPLNAMTVTADANGNVKGYLSNPRPDISNLSGKTVKNLVGQGTLRIIKDLGLKEPYIGYSEIINGGIAEDLAYYYYTSEQTPTVIALGVSLNDDNSVRTAGGYMVQLLPSHNEEFIDFLENKIKAILPITTLQKNGMTPEQIIKLIYDDMSTEKDIPYESYEILETKDINYHCNCNKERFNQGLITLGKKELTKIFDEKEEIEVKCEFCNTKYKYTKTDFIDILGDK